MTTKSAYIKTYGCQMNVYDSARMGEALAAAGYAPAEQAEGADLVILNTCHIREKAAEKVYSELGRLRPLKEKNDAVIFAVAGCVAQAEGAEMVARAPILDMVFGPQTYQALPEMLGELETARNANRASGRKAHIIRTDFPAQEKFDALHHTPRQPLTRAPSAFVTIQEGCDKFCTFCVVPYTRGGEVSRLASEIIAEVRALVAKGVCEITLLGQNVNAWQDPETKQGLAWLLAELSALDGVARLRFTTSHPRDMDNALIEAFGTLPKLMPYLHLPIQSGSDAILKAMNRRHKAQDYLDIIAQLRVARPDLALSSDFIVGFPSETDDDFQATLQLVEQVNFAQSYSFKYSPRPGTPAAEAETQIPEDVKAQRLDALQTRLKAQQSAFNTAQIGRTLPVLFEKRGRENGQMVGRSPYLQIVHADAPESVRGTILPVYIETAQATTLSGRLA